MNGGFCVRCNRVFSGHEVLIAIGSDGEPELHCPGAGCDSSPRHWFFYGSGYALHRTGGATATPPTEIDFNLF